MTRRILVSFLAVLVVVITAIVVPLGLAVTAQQRRDFTDSARAAARSLASLAEEQLDDHASVAALPHLLSTAAGADDRVAVLDNAGAVVAATAQQPSAAAVAAVRARQPLPAVDGHIVVTAVVGDGSKTVGTVVLARDSTGLDNRIRTLWLALSGAALLALIFGAAVGWSLGRWISRPLRSLISAAHGIGAGNSDARADQAAGPVQVRQVAHAFNEMAHRVSTLLGNQRGMTAEVSHQLRTPLAALRLRLELMADDADYATRTEAAAMLAETDRLSRLVDGLLAIARAEATESAPVPTDVGKVATERLQAWEPIAAERQITLEQPPAAPVLAALTAGHLEQILDNLLANAIDVVPPGGRVTVTIGRNGEQPVLSVEDTGPGMSEQQRARAFDPYTTDRGGRGGTGLGLAIVARLVATDHGTAVLHPAPGGGLRVVIEMQPGDSAQSPSRPPTRPASTQPTPA
jgi:signal transduction histidine kinase